MLDRLSVASLKHSDQLPCAFDDRYGSLAVEGAHTLASPSKIGWISISQQVTIGVRLHEVWVAIV